jgi:hypothetical protein
VGEGSTLRGSKIVANTLASFIAAAVALLEHHGMDDPRHLMRSGHTHKKEHTLLFHVLDRHKLMCIERRTRQPITREMIDIMMYLDQHASYVGTAGWTTSWLAHCNWMILGLFTSYIIGEYIQTNNCSYINCARGERGNGSGEFTGTPLAACQPDFLFFDFCSNTVPYSNKLNCPGFIKIRFHWQKSQRHG